MQEDPHPRVSSLGPLTDPSFGCCHRDCGHRVQGVACSFFPVVKTEAASGDCPLQGLLNCLKEIPEARDRHPSLSGASDPQLREDPGAWKRNSGGKGRRLGREAPGHHLLPFSAPSRPSTTRHSGPHVSVSAGVVRRWGSCYIEGAGRVGGASVCKCSRLALRVGAEGSRRKAGMAGRERQKAEGRAPGSAHSGLFLMWRFL